jgi:8-oxo-dGTP diphosphatase
MTWQERVPVVPAAYVIMRRADKILLIRRFHTGYMDGKYTLPSGHIEGGEPANVAAAREAQEEVGVTIDPDTLTLAHVIHRVAQEGGHERIDMFFEATSWQGEPQNMEPDKCDDLMWAVEQALPDTMVPEVRVAIDAIRQNMPFTGLGFEGAA